MRFALRPLPHLFVLAVACGGGLGLRAADATSPVDLTQRNAPFAPGSTGAAVTPPKQAPADKANSRVQERRFETSTVERKMAPQAGRRAAIDVQEARDKNVWEKQSRRPEVKEQPISGFNHRPAAISTEADTSKPPIVTKYQESLTAASATNMARFPAIDRATSAKINRFVFRKNPPETAGALEDARVTPAAGGATVGK